jgi:hypothetical protein
MTANIVTLQAQLASLQSAYATGVRTVSYEGKSTTFGSPAEMREAMAALENAINGMTGANASPHSFVVRSTKGW